MLAVASPDAPALWTIGPHGPNVYVSQHCLGRVQAHHPTYGWRETLWLLERSTRLVAGEVAGFLARVPTGCPDTYYLTPDRFGIFVVARGRPEHSRPWTLVTYLRLSVGQRDQALALWGPSAA